MKKKYFRLSCVLAGALIFGGTAGLRADDTVVAVEVEAVQEDVVVEEEPAYQNQAQAAHDANLAEAAFEKIDAEIAELQDQLAAAEQDLEEAEEAVDQEKIDQATGEIATITAEIDAKVSERIGIEDGRIADLRASGMGWGEIAHELGVHPGVLGLGHSKDMTGGRKAAGAVTEQEIAEVTAMDMKSGNGKGHGASGTSGSPGTGKGHGADGSGKDKGDHGNSGDHGGGNGGGHGGGNGGGKGK